MERLFFETNDIVSRDPGGRGLTGHLKKPRLPSVYEALLKMERVLIITGFPIRLPSGLAPCETDGPAGVADLAYAFERCGITAEVVTDASCFEQVRAALQYRAPLSKLHLLEKDGALQAKRIVGELMPTHVFAVERPGKSADGHCRNARGQVIDDLLADTDLLYALAREAGAVSIAIGDGGNELGTGAYWQEVSSLLKGGELFAAVQDADFTLMAGVSNWWCWGVAALLGAHTKTDLLPSSAEETELMRVLLRAGAVDGVTKLPAMTVDGLSLQENLGVLSALSAALENYFARRSVYATEKAPFAFNW